jgi:Tfp pilus assembly protein PilO
MHISRSRLTIVVGTIALLVLATVAWFIVLSPRLSQAAELSSRADNLAAQNLTLSSQYNRTLDLAHKAPSAAREAQALFSRMPQQADLPEVIEQINAAAAQAGIAPADIQEITTAVPQAVAPANASVAASSTAASPAASGVKIATMAINIRAQGPADQMLAFVDNLAAIDRALLITGTQLVTVADSNQKGESALNFDGTMFVLQSRLPDLVATVNSLIERAGQGIDAIPTAPATADTAPVPLTPTARPSAGASAQPTN